MKDFRSIIAVTAIVVITAALAFVVAYLAGQSTSPATFEKQANSHDEKLSARPKDSARLLAPTTLSYYRVHVALDSTLQAGKHTFHLYAANVPGREGTCTYRDGRRWACGLRAYVALLNLVGSAAIECHPKDASKPDFVICHKGAIDLSEWMLEHGWARLHPGVTDKRYVAAVQAAKAAKVGIWVEKPPPQ